VRQDGRNALVGGFCYRIAFRLRRGFLSFEAGEGHARGSVLGSLGDTTSSDEADQPAQACKREREEDAGRGAERRRGHRQDLGKARGRDDPLDQRRADHERSEPEQRREPQGDDRREQRVAADRLGFLALWPALWFRHVH